MRVPAEVDLRYQGTGMNYGELDSRTALRLTILGLAVATLSLGGCDGDDTGGGGDVAAMTATDGSGGQASTGADTSADSGGALGPQSHMADIQPIWDAYCVVACHEPGGQWASNDLSGNAYDVLVSQPSTQNSLMNYVEPGNPDASYLWHKMKMTQMSAGGSGLNMPKALDDATPVAVVPQADLDKIEAWILQGALE